MRAATPVQGDAEFCYGLRVVVNHAEIIRDRNIFSFLVVAKACMRAT